MGKKGDHRVKHHEELVSLSLKYKIRDNNLYGVKLRKKRNMVWDSKPKEELEKEIRDELTNLNISLDNMVFDKITPKGRGTPLIKMTFLTAG